MEQDPNWWSETRDCIRGRPPLTAAMLKDAMDKVANMPTPSWHISPYAEELIPLELDTSYDLRHRDEGRRLLVALKRALRSKLRG